MNYYELLGIKVDASDDEIKDAYKREIKKWHPDINKDPEAVNISMKINEAKDILLDKEKRKEYDYSLKKEEEKVYNKYSNNNNDYSDTNNQDKEDNSTTEDNDKMLTKWQYLDEYLKYSNVGGFRKILAVLFVLLETLVCTIIKYLIIALAILCFYISDFIMMVYYYCYPIFIGFTLFVISIWVFKGNSFMLNNNINLIISLGVIIGSFISSFLLILIGNLLLSQSVFNFLYNKLDITLFKWAVGYKK